MRGPMPRGGISEGRAPRRHRLLADPAPGPLARAGGRDVLFRPGRDGAAAYVGRRFADIGLETAGTTAEISGSHPTAGAARADQTAGDRTARLQGHSIGR